ncbi:nucleoside monophosphate kinase [Candidatus Saccharibacteria bacterium]|nr:nucleoside monophosphate kinase [Candidatus Saccharibacteria bacterium]MBR3323283.1 nucleoside monophosphate kinase [Candidatus Saccharibacteria bacterium]
MIMIFGPAGAGKSTQAELLAEELGRKALSVGQICREEFVEYTRNGDMVPQGELAKAVMRRVKEVESGGHQVVLDGQPWGGDFVDDMKDAGMLQAIEIAIVLDVPKEECLRRLSARGRSDDREEVWNKKLNMFEQKIYTFLAGLEENGVVIKHVDGNGDINTVNERCLSRIW